MIRTGETIGDPVEFVLAQPELLPDALDADLAHDRKWQLANGFPSWQVILGEDLDVLVSTSLTTIDRDPENIDHTDQSGFFGTLYPGLFKLRVLGGMTIRIQAYQSPARINQTSEELGYRPGEDVFEIVHDIERYGTEVNNYKVPLIEWANMYLSEGQHPIAISEPVLFGHDRRDHMDGVRVQPKAVIAHVKDYVSAADDTTKRKHMFNFDEYTGAMTDIVNSGTRSTLTDADIEQRVNGAQVYRSLGGRTMNSGLLRPIGYSELHFPGKDKRSEAAFHRWLYDLMLPHLIDLNDRVRKLEARRAQEVAA